MKKSCINISLVILSAGWLASAAAGENLVTGGFSTVAGASTSSDSVTASFINVAYERKLSSLITLTAGLGSLDYTSKSSGSSWTYQEDGKGMGVFVDLNFYPGKEPFSGFYVGPGIRLTSLTSDWVERGTTFAYTLSGSNSDSLFDIHAKFGWKIDAGPVVIDPNLRLGYFLNAPTGNGANQDAALGFYMLIGANVGSSF